MVTSGHLYTCYFLLICTIDAVYTDFSKAFDKVDHSLCIKNIRQANIADLITDWIASVLSGRRLKVRVNGILSNWTDASSGVPQGSVIGTLLFNLYVNELPRSLNSSCLFFVDDLKLW